MILRTEDGTTVGGFCMIKSKQHANTGLRELLLTVLLAMSVDIIAAVQGQVDFLPRSHNKQAVHPYFLKCVILYTVDST